jgi:GH24 family phage-related lysozyme (muramidase)
MAGKHRDRIVHNFALVLSGRHHRAFSSRSGCYRNWHPGSYLLHSSTYPLDSQHGEEMNASGEELTVDPRLAADLDASEKNELEAYLDTEGFWTIGRGHRLPTPAPGKSWQGFTISEDVSDRFALEDALKATKAARNLPEWKALDTPCRQNALIELCFNMGPGSWGKWTPTRALMQAGDWEAVKNHLLASLWASQIQPHKFVNGVCERCHEQHILGVHAYCKAVPHGRADRIANYFFTGEYPVGA